MKYLAVLLILTIIKPFPSLSAQPSVTSHKNIVSKSDSTLDIITKEEEKQYWKPLSFRFIGTFDFGRETSMPCWPETSSFSYGMGGAPVNGYGFGIELDFRPLRNLLLFLDITAHSWKFQVGEKGSRSEGDWVWEQTDYTTRYTGTFESDVYFFMNTTLARLGARYIFPISEKAEPWIGIGYGYGKWLGNYLTANKNSTYGYDSDYAGSISYQMGIDFRLTPVTEKGKGMLLSIFLDMGSPVAKPIEVEDLFYDGWKWASTAGEHAILPYRVCLGLGF